MLGVHDPIDARLLYLKQGEAELLVLTFDVIGLMPKYVNMLKRRIAEDHGIARGAIVVNAVHNHEGPDSMGPWSAAGVAAWWIEPAMENVLSAVGPLLASTAPARLRAAAAYPVSCVDAATGALKTIADCDEPRDESMSGAHDVPLLERDIRDPWIRDMLVSAARLEKAEGGEAIATIVNWSNHPEALADENSLASSDFPGYARRRVEALGGGVGIYWSGAVGGLMTPLRGTAVPAWSIDGQRSSGPDLITEASFDKAISLGYEVGQTASDALQGAATDNAPTLEVETIDFDVPLTAELNLLFTLTTYFDESDKMLVFDGPGCAERGCLRSQVTHVRLGELEILTIPGELFPEYVVGRSASSVSYAGWPTYEFSSVAGLRDVMKGDVPMFVGLANAELGYMMPRGDFLKDGNPYLDGKAPYDHPNHYEESVSPGAAVGDLYCDRARALLGASGPCLGGL